MLALNIIKRTSTTILLLICAMVFPWWVLFIFLLGALFYWHRYWEAILIAMFADSLFSGSIGIYTIIFLLIFIFLEVARKRMIFEGF